MADIGQVRQLVDNVEIRSFVSLAAHLATVPMNMKTRRPLLNTTRASRDGHEFHEEWTARRALELVFPLQDFVGLSVEGLPPKDTLDTGRATEEIADVAEYYGSSATFRKARHLRILQFKYSIASKSKPFRQADARETFRKFLRSYTEHVTQYGLTAVRRKLRFLLVTNRSVDPTFAKAIECMAAGKAARGGAAAQAKQIKSSLSLSDKDLRSFMSLVGVISAEKDLTAVGADLSRTVLDWAPSTDSDGRARIGELRRLVRKKCGSDGATNNLITRTDVIAALGLQGPDDLFPCAPRFPETGPLLARSSIDSSISEIPQLTRPLVVHAKGGVGKTVFMRRAEKELQSAHSVVLFDSFGGGAYRNLDDGRHLPRNGFVHIANQMACLQLCDPLLSGGADSGALLKAFRGRLSQAVTLVRKREPGRRLILLIDAVDNAIEHARSRSEECFSEILLESLGTNPIPGVVLVVSCRTHRLPPRRSESPCEYLEVPAFSAIETADFLNARLSDVTDIEVRVAHSRSSGNPRVLEYLLTDRSLLDPSELNRPLEVEALLAARIDRALAEARIRSSTEAELQTLLTALAVLPPPVPVKDLAEALNVSAAAIESFSVDLAPLLEYRAPYGLMFRDEPTETLVCDTYGKDVAALNRLLVGLENHQSDSMYAAVALPGLLRQTNNSAHLFDLAFSDQFPSEVRTESGKQRIRYSRLTAAASDAAANRDFERLVSLLVELSCVAAANERGTSFAVEHPELVSAAQDNDAGRRLFETRTQWPGTRHARLAIRYFASAEFDSAYRHGQQLKEWIDHYDWMPRTEGEGQSPGPDAMDRAAYIVCLVGQGQHPQAPTSPRF